MHQDHPAYVGRESDPQSYVDDANLGLPVCGPVSATCAKVTSNPRIDQDFTAVLCYYSDGIDSLGARCHLRGTLRNSEIPLES
jgi:hypothetical protein